MMHLLLLKEGLRLAGGVFFPADVDNSQGGKVKISETVFENSVKKWTESPGTFAHTVTLCVFREEWAAPQETISR